MRVAVVPCPDGGCWLAESAEDGEVQRTVRHEDLVRAVAERERGGDVRWIWAANEDVYPALLRAGARVERCHDVALAESLLLSREGRPGEPASLAGAWARLRGAAAPAAQVTRRAAVSGQAALFEPADPVFPSPRAALDALVAVHAEQQRRIAADEYPGRFALLAAAESAGGLVAAEMRHCGLPWRADVHAALLTSLLGERPVAGMRPPRLAGLAARISAAFGGRPVNPDSPAQVLRALAADGIRVSSTRAEVLRAVDHPAAALLLEYKELARLHAAHGWSWLDEWVTAGRFRPEYVVGGVVSGRWASRGGGALQIPRVLRRAVVADPGWVLIVADAAQLEPRILAALAGDQALAAAAASGDLYLALADAFGGDRAKAKIALLSAMYGGAAGEARQLLAVLRHRFPRAAQYVESAARAGEEGKVVRSRLGRTCPPPSQAWRDRTAEPDDPDSAEPGAGRWLRARGRFTRNFVVQASAADWAVVFLAGLRRRLAVLQISNGSPQPSASAPSGAAGAGGAAAGAGGAAAGAGRASPGVERASPGVERASPGVGSAAFGGAGRPCLVFFQHDEVIVHTPRALAGDVVAAVGEAAEEAGRLVFGPTLVRFPVITAEVASYADAK